MLSLGNRITADFYFIFYVSKFSITNKFYFYKKTVRKKY